MCYIVQKMVAQEKKSNYVDRQESNVINVSEPIISNPNSSYWGELNGGEA